MELDVPRLRNYLIFVFRAKLTLWFMVSTSKRLSVTLSDSNEYES